MSLYVTKAHPNPAGKDKSRLQPPDNEKLNEEWIEFTNNGTQTEDMTGVSLHDRTYDDRCNSTGERKLQTYRGSLAPGHSLRIHSGSGTAIDSGALRHLYLDERNFVWNNRCGDQVILRKNTSLVDWAAYDPNPAEGQTLTRKTGTNKLS